MNALVFVALFTFTAVISFRLGWTLCKRRLLMAFARFLVAQALVGAGRAEDAERVSRMGPTFPGGVN